jgi:hypothetical protein
LLVVLPGFQLKEPVWFGSLYLKINHFSTIESLFEEVAGAGPGLYAIKRGDTVWIFVK